MTPSDRALVRRLDDKRTDIADLDGGNFYMDVADFRALMNLLYAETGRGDRLAWERGHDVFFIEGKCSACLEMGKDDPRHAWDDSAWAENAKKAWLAGEPGEDGE